MTQAITIAVSDEITALTPGASKITFPIETDFVVTNARAFLSTPQATGAEFTVDVKALGVSIFSTKLTIDNGQPSSVNAAAPAVIANPALTDYSPISIDIDQIGDGSAKGLKVTLYGYRPLANSAVSTTPPVTPPGTPTESQVSASAGSTIGDMTVFGIANAFDGVTNAAETACAAISGSPGWVGKALPSPTIFSRAIVYGANNGGFLGGAAIAAAITIYGSNTAPSGPTGGTAIGSLAFTNTNNESAGRQIASTDKVNAYSYIWAYINGGAVSTYCAELVLYELS